MNGAALTYEGIEQLHNRALYSIGQFINSGSADLRKNRVLVTHFLPSFRCTHDKFKYGREAQLNDYFCANLDDSLLEYFDTCIYGHSHEVVDTTHAATTLTNNPGGIMYIHGEGRDFRTDKVLSDETTEFLSIE